MYSVQETELYAAHIFQFCLYLQGSFNPEPSEIIFHTQVVLLTVQSLHWHRF